MFTNVHQQLQAEASALLFFWRQIEKEHWQCLWSGDFISHISTVALLMVFGWGTGWGYFDLLCFLLWIGGCQCHSSNRELRNLFPVCRGIASRMLWHERQQFLSLFIVNYTAGV